MWILAKYTLAKKTLFKEILFSAVHKYKMCWIKKMCYKEANNYIFESIENL